MTVLQAAGAAQGRVIGEPDAGFVGAAIDSREVQPGNLFFALPGERVDGHRFVDAAFERGAAACVVSEEYIDRLGQSIDEPNHDSASGTVDRPSQSTQQSPQGASTTLADRSSQSTIIASKSAVTGSVDRPSQSTALTATFAHTLIAVPSVSQALRDIAAAYRQDLAATVIAVTGSMGKSSTKEFIASVLTQRYRTYRSEGNHNNAIGLPLTILNIPEDTEVAVLELGISDFGEMSVLGAIARPDIAVYTNIAACHLERLHDLDGVLRAKAELLEYTRSAVVINARDPKLAQLQSRLRMYTYADTPLPSDIVLRLPGEHQRTNAAAALRVGEMMGCTYEEIKAGLECCEPLPGHGTVRQIGRLTVIDDCYNANPAAMQAALDLLMSYEPPRAAILGDMLELGASSCELHRETGAYAASLHADTLMFVGPCARFMRDGAGQGLYFETVDEAIAALDSVIADARSVLVKASHGMHFERIVRAIEQSRNVCSE